jgi:hypothetical protein
VKVQVAKVQVAKVQVAKVQVAKVQVAKVQVAKVQVAKVQVAKVQVEKAPAEGSCHRQNTSHNRSPRGQYHQGSDHWPALVSSPMCWNHQMTPTGHPRSPR